MYNLRTELIKSILSSLKIDDNPFNQQIVKDKIYHIADEELQNFYGKLFDASHQYLNGIDRVAKVAEQFKPIAGIDENEIKAKELILLVKGMNNSVFRDSEKYELTFDELLKVVEFPAVSDEDKAVLNAVKPFCELKSLIKGINTYSTSLETLRAFKQAISQPSVTQLNNPVEKLRIRKG